MSTKLWEDTVVTALRDEKWLHAMRGWRKGDDTVPHPQIKLKQNAEQRLGDFIDVHDSHFFLFEVKGTREDIEDEWHTNNKDKGRQKDAFRAHRLWLTDQNKSDYKALLWDSVRAHFFAYWAEYSSDQSALNCLPEDRTWNELTQIGECVAIEPYVLACVSMRDQQPARAEVNKLSTPYRIAIAQNRNQRFKSSGQNPILTAPDETGTFEALAVWMRQQIPLSLVYEQCGYAVIEDFTPPWPTIKTAVPLGLPLAEFTGYITNLCSLFGSEAEPIHAVVLSSSGNFFRVLTNTAQLKDLLKANPQPTPTAGEWPQTLRAGMKDERKKKLRAKLEQQAQEQAKLATQRRSLLDPK